MTIYFTIPTGDHQLTMLEIHASDQLNAGMLEHVASTNAGELYSWHDLKSEDIINVLRYIRENIGNYKTDIDLE